MASVLKWWEELEKGWDVQGWMQAGSLGALLLVKGIIVLLLGLGFLSSRIALSNELRRIANDSGSP